MKMTGHSGTSEPVCKTVQESVLAHLDNEPKYRDWRRIEEHLASCSACSQFAENSAVLKVRLRDELKDDVDAVALWSRVSLALDAETQTGTKAQGERFRVKSKSLTLFFGAVAAAMLVGVFTFSPLGYKPSKMTPQAVTESINDFLTFRASGRMLDVKSSEPLALRKWLVKRLDFEIPLNSTVPAGFKLSGARLCSFLNRRMAAFVYHMDEKAAALYVMTETGLEATLRHLPKSNELTVFSSRGLINVVWRSDGLLYVVVADFAENEAIKFARSVGKTNTALPLKVTQNRPGANSNRRG